MLKLRIRHNDSYFIIDAAGQAEALYMLHKIRELREQHTTTLEPVMSKVYHTLAMLHYLLQDYPKVSVVLEYRTRQIFGE